MIDDFHIGIDIGSTTVKVIVLDDSKIWYLNHIKGIYQILKIQL